MVRKATNQKQISAALRRLQGLPDEMGRTWKIALDRTVLDFRTLMIKEQFHPFRSPRSTFSSPSGGLQNRRGAAGLAGTVGGTVTGRKLNQLRASVTVGDATHRYARIQEKGGTIRPKKARALTIPIGDNFTQGGDVRYSSVAAARRDKSVSVFQVGKLIMVDKAGKRGSAGGRGGGNQIDRARSNRLDRLGGKSPTSGRARSRGKRKATARPYWVLKDSVKIPPRLGFVKTFRSPEMRKTLLNHLERATRAAIKRVTQGTA